MNDPESSINQAEECCSEMKAKLDDWMHGVERSAREEPLKTAGIALAAGILLTILPVGRLLAGLVQITLALLRPALLILGVMKVVKEIDRRNKS